jgi:uncharacterized protein
MKKLVMVAIALAFAVQAQAGTVTAPFYKIEKNGQTAYLLGTIHTGVNYSDLASAVHNAVEAADTIVLETDIGGASALMASAFPMGPDNSLKDQLTPDEWQKLYDRLVAIPGTGKLIEPLIDQLNPAVASSLYQVTYLPETAEPIDQTIYSIGQKEKKNFVGFEPIQDQIDVLKKTGTVDALKQMLAAPMDQLAASMDQLTAAYTSGDEATMTTMFVDTMAPDEKQIMLIDRNNKWLGEFDQIFDAAGTEFIAVGTAHLLSDVGLVHQLQLKGYTLSKVPN